MRIKNFVFNPFYENTILVSSKNGDSLIFDPGCYEKHEQEELSDYIASEGLTIKGLINTHCHIDHVLGNHFVCSKYGVELQIPIHEQKMYEAVAEYAPQWGILNYQEAKVGATLKDGDTLTLGELHFKTIEVPGHSPGHLVFYLESEKILIGGDVLFRESIGRTDLPGGNHEDLLKNIEKRVYTLPDEVRVLPGHGSYTSIGHEKKHNPFVKGK